MATPGPAVDTPTISLVEIRGIDALAPYLPLLDELVLASAEPNPFHEPWMLLPALECYAAGEKLLFLLVLADRGSGAGRRLVGFFPLHERRRFRGLPLRHVALWKHPHGFLGTPLLRRGFARQALEALLAWFEAADRYGLLDLHQVGGDGEAYEQARALLASGRLKTLEQRYERAFFQPAEDAGRYLRKVMSGKSIKEYGRLLRRLADRGEVRWDELPASGPIGAWVDEFLALEASGWKGRSGTALASSETGDAFFRSMAAGAFARRRLVMLALRFEHRPIAMIAVLLQGRGGYAFKMAYDEQHRQTAPGVQLLIELNRRLHEREDFAWMDSCAAPDSALANRLWLQRKPLCNLVIARPRTAGAAALRIVPGLARVRKRFTVRSATA